MAGVYPVAPGNPPHVTTVFAMQTQNVQYYKRYRMELDLRSIRIPSCAVPHGYRLLAWAPRLLEGHAEVKYLSFRDEIDSQLFPCLGQEESCLRLMDEIRVKEGFLPEATWLAEYIGAGPLKTEYCGTIQAIRSEHGRGGIQNIGVTPFHRNRGVGQALLLASLRSLQYLGIMRARLEVTARNEGAIRLYRRLGFRTTRTFYKSVDLVYSDASR